MSKAASSFPSGHVRGSRERVVIGLDVGTSRCKAVAATAEGVIRATAWAEYGPTDLEGPVYQDVSAVERAAGTVLRRIMQEIKASSVAGLCLSGAMHSLLAVDRDGRPIGPAMTWLDQRAAKILPRLRRELGGQAAIWELYRRTGCPLQATYHPARLRWLNECEAELVRRTWRWAAIKDWLLYRLTDSWATDWSIASASGLMDIHRLEWFRPALELAGIGESELPPLVPPEQIVGVVTRRAAQAYGLPAGLPVIAGASDGALANLGAGAVQAGQVIVSAGTSGAVRVITSRPRLPRHGKTWCYVLTRGRYLAGGAINNAGLAVEWVRRVFYADLPAERGRMALLKEAASLPAGAEGVIFVPYLGGERSPHWLTEPAAGLLNLRLEHSRAAVARAALEAVGFCLREVWQAMRLNRTVTAARLTGSIVRSGFWCQVLADILGVDLFAIEAADASALGAAFLGHWALGHVPKLEIYQQNLSRGHLPHHISLVRHRPKMHRLYGRRYREFCSLARLLIERTEGRRVI